MDVSQAAVCRDGQAFDTRGRYMTQPTHQGAGAGASHRPTRRLRSLLFALLFVPVLLACGSTSIRVTQLDTAPAAALRLDVYFTGALVPGDNVKLNVAAHDSNDSNVSFTGSQGITVSGVSIPRIHDQTFPNIASIPQQPRGGSYTLVYTDEHGQKSSLTIP